MGNKESKCPDAKNMQSIENCPKGTKPGCILKTSACTSQPKPQVEGFGNSVSNKNLLLCVLFILMIMVVQHYNKTL